MESSIVYWGYVGESGKENGNLYSMLGLYRTKKLETTI